MSALLSADDLNDFITPGAACVKPAEPHDDARAGEVEIQIDKHGNRLEVSKASGLTNPLSAAQISLADCLACSGCITSAEEILVAQHSHDELLKALHSSQDKTFVASISHQSRASLATALAMPVEAVDRLLIDLFVRQMGFSHVVGTSLGRKLSLISESYSVMEHKKKHPQQPLLSSVCPGWVLYAEKTHPYILPRLSDIKSPQQITGCLLKHLAAKQHNVSPDQIYHLSIMPCFDKKLESARPEKESSHKDVDCVLTAKELIALLDQNPQYQLVPEAASSPVPIADLYQQSAPAGWPFVEYAWAGDSGSTSGGYAFTYLNMFKHNLLMTDPTYADENFSLQTVAGKNADIYELRLLYNGEKLASAAVVNGFRNIQNLVRKFKPGQKSGKSNPLVARRRARVATRTPTEEETADASKCDYVEVMACPNGCINGGGQISHPAELPEKDWLDRVILNYRTIPSLDLSAEGIAKTLVPDVVAWSENFAQEFHLSEARLLKTWFKEVEKPTDPNAIILGAKW